MKKNCYYVVSVIFAAIGWGFIGLFNRILADMGVDAIGRTAIRNIGSLFILTIFYFFLKPSVFHIQKKHFPIFLGSGLISVLGLGLTYFSCQMRCSLAVAGILLYLAPSFVVIMSRMIWKESITNKKAVALILTLLGCFFISGILSEESSASLTGILLGIAAGFCYATYTIFSRFALNHYDSSTMTYWTFLVAGTGSLCLLLLDCPENLTQTFSQGKGVVGALGLVVIATILPYCLYTKGLEGLEGGKAAVIANVEPLVAALVGVALFHERLDIYTVLGIALVIFGIVVLQRSGHGRKKKN